MIMNVNVPCIWIIPIFRQKRRRLLCFSMPDCGSLILHKREARGGEAVIDRRTRRTDGRSGEHDALLLARFPNALLLSRLGAKEKDVRALFQKLNKLRTCRVQSSHDIRAAMGKVIHTSQKIPNHLVFTEDSSVVDPTRE